MRIKIYLDEDVPLPLAQGMQNRGVDVITTQQAGNLGKTDEEQLIFAGKTERAILTHNIKDYILLGNQFQQEKREHYGIILSDQLPAGVLLKRIMKLWFSLKPGEIKNRYEFLSNWR